MSGIHSALFKLVLIIFRQVKGHPESGQIGRKEEGNKYICLQNISVIPFIKGSNRILKFNIMILVDRKSGLSKAIKNAQWYVFLIDAQWSTYIQCDQQNMKSYRGSLFRNNNF